MSYAVAFYCRKSKANAKGEASLEMSITLNGERCIVSLPRRMKPADFDKEMAARRCNETKDFCDNYRRQIDKAVAEIVASGQQPSAAKIKYFVFAKGGSNEVKVKLSDLWHKWYEANKLRVGYTMTLGVFRKYQLSFDSFKAAIGDKALDDVTSGDIQTWVNSIHAEQSTVFGYYSKVRSVFHFGIGSGITSNNPCVGVKVSKGVKDIEALTEVEIAAIERVETGIERIDKVRDIFLFQCFSGMAYVDAMAMSIDDVEREGDYYVYRGKRQKTGVPFVVVLSGKALGILNRYGGRLPGISNQKLNAYLKTLGDLAGIRKSLHSHLARHSYACMMLNRGLSLDIVAKTLGHTRVTMTQHYAKLMDRTVVNALAQVL